MNSGLEHHFISPLHAGLIKIRIIGVGVYHLQDLIDFILHPPDGDYG